MAPKILLCTLNSTYQHTAFGLRYLYAQMDELRSDTRIFEGTLAQNPKDVAEAILRLQPQIVGFGIYIWNVRLTTEVLRLLKDLNPNLKIVIGGPEVSHEYTTQEAFQLCDHLIPGEADLLFPELCRKILAGDEATKVYSGSLPNLKDLKTPYPFYSDDDIQNRLIYVEASRGCVYKCEYCLSSLDKGVRAFDIDAFLSQMESLIARGARDFKFVDRTFNLNPKIATQILQFFLDRKHLGLFLHFEMVPDRLPEEIKSLLPQFLPGQLQFEVGIQTWNPLVAANVSRRQNFEKIQENLSYLRAHTHVHTHADLIVGLPGETLDSFAEGFNALYDLEPSEIQVGLLKFLKGTPIARHTKNFEMLYQNESPFQILKTKDMDFFTIQKMSRFAKFWDLVANSGNFQRSLRYLVKAEFPKKPFQIFSELSEFLFSRHPQGHGISLIHLTESLWTYMTQTLSLDKQELGPLMAQDFVSNKKRDLPSFLKYFSPSNVGSEKRADPSNNKRLRQARHLTLQEEGRP